MKIKNNKKLGHGKKNYELILMSLPAIIKIFIFSYIPILGVIIAFKHFIPSKGVLDSPWVGFKNFEFFFKSQTAIQVLRNTLGLNLISIILALIFNVFFAFLLYEISSKIMLKTYQTIMFIPYFFSWALVGLMFTALLNPYGLLTEFIKNLTGSGIDFYNQPIYWVFILPIVSAWKGMGFGSLIYYTVLMSIDKELFEAAEIDGASKIQMIKSISIPFLIPMICVLTILAMGNIIRADFGLFYFVPKNQTGLYSVTDVIDTYVFRALAQNGDFAMSSAVGLFQSLVGFILVLLTNQIAKKIDSDYSLF